MRGYARGRKDGKGIVGAAARPVQRGAIDSDVVGLPKKAVAGAGSAGSFGGNRCTCSSEGITSSDGVAAEAQEGVPPGQIGFPSDALVFRRLAAKISTGRGEPMTTAPRNRLLVVGIMVALAVLLFFLDVPFPRGMTPAPLFVAVVGASMWLPGLRPILLPPSLALCSPSWPSSSPRPARSTSICSTAVSRSWPSGWWRSSACCTSGRSSGPWSWRPSWSPRRTRSSARAWTA